MSDQVAEIKNKIDIVELVGERVNLKKAGRHFKGLCPFHSEKSPSFIVSPERQSYKCFGCGEAGDAISFLQKYDGMSFLEALELLAKRVGVELESYRPTAADTQKKRLLDILARASEYYGYLLKTHEAGQAARDYLATRGVGKEAMQTFALGYAPNQWRGVSSYLGKKGYSEAELEAAGLVIRGERGVYDRFRGRVMFPLRDHKGGVVGFAGRTLSTDASEAKYINSPETSLYHKSRMLYGLWENREQIRKRAMVLIVEGELDMIASWQAGVGQVVAIKGSAFTEEMGQLIARYTTNVAFALDADSAGEEAIKRAVKVVEPLGLSIRVIQVKEGKDPGEVATSAPSAWREMVKVAVLYWDFLLESLCKRFDPATGAGAAAISQAAVPEIAMISNVVVRARYVRELARRLGVPEESVYAELERFNKKQALTGLKTLVKSIERGEEPVGRRQLLAERLLALALQFYPELKERLGPAILGLLEVGAVAKVMTALLEYRGEWEINAFAAKLPEELQAAVNTAYMTDLSGVDAPGKEWEQVEREAREESLRAGLKHLHQEIARLEQGGKEQELGVLQQQFAKLSRELAEVSL